MNQNEARQKVIYILEKQALCVISTVSTDGKPESALVGFSANDKLELLIGSSRKSRKFNNVKQRPHVSVVVHDGENTTVQYEGMASQLLGTELSTRLQLHFTKLPSTQKYLDDPNQVWISIQPEWLQLVTTKPSYKAVEIRGLTS